jgi:pyruvate carboxylase subunit B
MKGIILKIKVGVGEEINKGEIIAILEAMKMQNDVLATHDGIVKEICVSEGSNVSPGTVIMVVK